MSISTATGLEYTSGEDFYDHVLNDMFLPGMADTVINPNELLKRITRDSSRVQGKMVVFPVHIGRNYGGNAIAPGGDLPDPKSQQYDGYSFPVRHIYHRILFDGISMDASKSDVASWLRAVDSEVKGASIDMARRRNRIFNNDGSGNLAEITAGGGTATLTLQINQQIEDPDTVSTADFPPTTFFHPGMRIAGMTSGGASIAVVTVTAVLNDTQITVDGTTLANGDWITEVSNTTTTTVGDTAYNVEPMGIAGIFSDGNPGVFTDFQGIDASVAANSWHRANILENTGVARDLSEALLQKAFSDSIRIGEAKIDCLFSNFGMVNTYINLLIGDKRFVNTTTLQGGAKAIDFNGIPWIADRDAYANRVYFMDEANIRCYVMAEPQWMNYDGSNYHRLENKDKYQATMFCRETLGVDVRDKCTLLTDLNES